MWSGYDQFPHKERLRVPEKQIGGLDVVACFVIKVETVAFKVADAILECKHFIFNPGWAPSRACTSTNLLRARPGCFRRFANDAI